jgi:RimJ/RimL family protein N-acetyltransferase
LRLSVRDEITLAGWVSERIGRVIEPPYTVLGFEDQTDVVAAAVFNDYQPGGNIEMTFAADQPFTRGMFRAIAHYVFVQLGCARLTVRTKQANECICDLATRLGFRREATLKDYFGKKEHAELFRMTRKECRWL